ncbi:hypothetical protein ACRE_068680 [Hapsidospora chrysogenum ATCC 11550]|uniref:Uncharacterized protein n=1 Tax=Hapsidospora chrysogenum (strain ATCC 11550 / CBS 779.69 / DSM 880 / IAM 14645 / JCM 23072 / IMI 49137) TaxID=857340 RepID=A0A086SZ61_HAPC1|nr:hypothetical protein ACRE_068680 [Hapsidospora chrysogenum ATCC 11550]
MLLSRVPAARHAFAAPVSIAHRPFSTSLPYRDQRSRRGGSDDRPVRTNPLIGNYVAPKPAQPNPKDAPPTSTENPQSSQPPSPDKAPISSAEVPPNADMPPPPPPPQAAAAADAKPPAAKSEHHPYNAASSTPDQPFDLKGIVGSDVASVMSKFASNYARNANLTKDPMSLPRVRTAAVTGRTVFVQDGSWTTQGQARNPEHAFRMLNQVVSESRIKSLVMRQRFHERPGLKRKRLKMQRWRRRFKDGFKATAERVLELKKQGW